MSEHIYREKLTEFLKCYKNEPCLWNTKSKSYHDRAKKDEAYNRLIKKYRSIDSNANRDTVVKKINNIRSSYRKQLNRIKSQGLKSSSDETHLSPRMWYFHLLDFLYEQENSESSTSNSRENGKETCALSPVKSEETLPQECEAIQSQPENEVANVFPQQFVETQHATSPEPSATQEQDSIMVESSPEITASSRAIAKRRIFRKHLSPIPTKTICYPKEAVDEFEIAGRKYASDIRNMNQQQRLIAEKLVAEVIYNAKMEQLNVNSYIQLENNFQ